MITCCTMMKRAIEKHKAVILQNILFHEISCLSSSYFHMKISYMRIMRMFVYIYIYIYIYFHLIASVYFCRLVKHIKYFS